MKYKAGDKVRVREDLKHSAVYGKVTFVEEMIKYYGATLTVVEVYDDCYLVKENLFSWSDEMFIHKDESPEYKAGDWVVVTKRHTHNKANLGCILQFDSFQETYSSDKKIYYRLIDAAGLYDWPKNVSSSCALGIRHANDKEKRRAERGLIRNNPPKPETPFKPLFECVDSNGNTMFEGDKYWWVDPHSYEVRTTEGCKIHSATEWGDGVKFFNSKDTAQEYSDSMVTVYVTEDNVKLRVNDKYVWVQKRKDGSLIVMDNPDCIAEKDMKFSSESKVFSTLKAAKDYVEIVKRKHLVKSSDTVKPKPEWNEGDIVVALEYMGGWVVYGEICELGGKYWKEACKAVNEGNSFAAKTKVNPEGNGCLNPMKFRRALPDEVRYFRRNGFGSNIKDIRDKKHSGRGMYAVARPNVFWGVLSDDCSKIDTSKVFTVIEHNTGQKPDRETVRIKDSEYWAYTDNFIYFDTIYEAQSFIHSRESKEELTEKQEIIAKPPIENIPVYFKDIEENDEEIGQEELCEYCKDTFFDGSVNSGPWNLCEGAKCDEAREMYLDDNDESNIVPKPQISKVSQVEELPEVKAIIIPVERI